MFVQRDGTVRLGWHPERSFVVTAPPEVEPAVLLDVLRRLDGVHSRAHSIWYAGTVGLSANAMSTLLAELGECGLLSDGSASVPAADRSIVVSTVVHILGRGPIADAVVAGMTPSSGVVVHRSAVAPAQLLGPDEERWKCDMAVLTDDLTPDPRVVSGLVRTRTPHLQVRLRDGRGIVGPFVLPGITSCLRCAELVRCSLDPQWPHVSAQLLGRVGTAPKPTILATAALALAQIESFVDGRRAPLTDTTVELDLANNAMARRAWTRHPLCDCAMR